MDPEAVLDRILTAANSIIALIDENCDPDGEVPEHIKNDVVDEADELAQAVRDLDNWRSRGGFLPRRWAETRFAAWRTLLQNLAAGLNRTQNTALAHIVVVLISADGRQSEGIPVPALLDWMANDITTDNESEGELNSFDEARILEVETI